MLKAIGRVCPFVACLLLVALRTPAQQPVTLTFAQPQTAGISGFRALWDTPVVTAEDGVAVTVDLEFNGAHPMALWNPDKRAGGAKPGALVFDAVHRSLLVRFPDAAVAIAAQVAKGYAVRRVELVLPYRAEEYQTEGYDNPPGMSFLGPMWKNDPPRWHAVAWALRVPWIADAKLGPTFNSSVNGLGYWAKYGAQDTTRDRYPTRFGPAEVSFQHTVGWLDLTALLTKATYGNTLAQRLRQFADCGVLLRKEEVYDARYLYSGYEWGTATGGRGILLHAPKLEVTLEPTDQAPAMGALPPAADVRDIVCNKGAQPTAVIPDAEQITALAAKYGFVKPAWMPDWQWARVQELNTCEKQPWDFPNTPAAYNKWVDNLLAMPPRYWVGWGSGDKASQGLRLGAAMPAPVLDNEKLYWWAWLMPDRDISSLVHPYGPGAEKVHGYYERTGDWRGNTNLFRPYCYNISTMNFNHTCPAGSLLGGALIGAENVIADGRNGLENFPLRLWSWYDGTTQESIDHYYFSITLSDQKEFADFGPTPYDRLLGKNILVKSVDELVSAFHPGLRRFISPSGRTTPECIWVTQDGTTHIVNTLSHGGIQHDIGNPDTANMPAIGHDAPPERIARQTIEGPWAPEWMANLVDEKPLPFQMTTAYKMWGHYADTPLWRRDYLGRHYGLASQDISEGGECVPIMALWKRTEAPATTVQSIGSLLLRYTTNEPNFVDTHQGGIVFPQGGLTATLQHKNKMIVCTSPDAHNPVQEIRSLQSTIALFDFEKTPSWELYVDEQRVTAYPVHVKAGQRITLKDGVSFLGIIPLPSTDLGRTDEVVITDQTGPIVRGQDGGKIKPALYIHQYNLLSAAPLKNAALDWQKIDQAYGGFVIEMGDATEYADFAAFQQHLHATKLDTSWDDAKKTLAVKYASGADTLACTYRPEFAPGAEDIPTDQCFPTRTVNGQWPYLAEGILRDSPVTQQGITGKLEKGGATLLSEYGHMAFLQHEPLSGTFAASNPLPDAQYWALQLPDGVEAQADGRVGLLRLTINPKTNAVTVDYGVKPGATTTQMAGALLLFGLPAAPAVILNDEKQPAPAQQRIGERLAYVLPLDGPLSAAQMAGLSARTLHAQQVLARLNRPASRPEYVQDWYVIGPFFNNYLGEGLAMPIAAGQEPINLQGVYPGKGDKEVRWTHILPAGEPALAQHPVSVYKYIVPSKEAAAFAYTQIHADRARDVTLYLGVDERIMVWLNGEKVFTYPYYRIAVPDQYAIPVHLKQGDNTVLLKLAHAAESWSLYFRVGTADGLPISEGISYGVGK